MFAFVLADIDATVQRWIGIVGLVTGVLVLAGMIYRVVRRVDRAVTRVEEQVKPNGDAKAAGTQDVTTRDLLDRTKQDVVDVRHEVAKVRRRNDVRHEENRADMHRLSDALEGHLEQADRTTADVIARLIHLEHAEQAGADVFARLAALEDRRHDDRPPRLEHGDDE